MKIFISADIEGVTGVTAWSETEYGKSTYTSACQQMTKEIVAACTGALQAGATEFLIKDAHSYGRNIIADELPPESKLIRSWSAHPAAMVQELSSNIHALMYIGYHSGAGSSASPLSHTMSSKLEFITLNGEPISEFDIYSLYASSINVPTVLLTGDAGICEQAKKKIPLIETVAVKECKGLSTINLHPKTATIQIQEASKRALQKDVKKCLYPIPNKLQLELHFKEAFNAEAAQYYPGAKRIGERSICILPATPFDLARDILFISMIRQYGAE